MVVIGTNRVAKLHPALSGSIPFEVDDRDSGWLRSPLTYETIHSR